MIAEDNEQNPPRRFGLPKVRESVIEKLAAAYANGNLDLDDYEHRVALAEEATSFEELEAIVADFPAVTLPGAPGPISPVAQTGGRFYFTLFGDKKISAGDLEDNAASVLAIIGDVKIDLTNTSAPIGTIFEITVVSFFGDTKIRVPRRTRVISQSLNLIGDEKRKISEVPEGGENYVLRIHGFKLIGDVKITEV